MKITQTLAMITTAFVFGGASVEAGDYFFSGWVPPNHVTTRTIHQGWADLVREATKGEVNFEVFSGGALLPALGTMQGVGSGVAQAGHIAATYHPKELPITYMVGNLGFDAPDSFVLGAAHLDFIMHDPEAQAEWRSHDLLPGGALSTANYNIICRMPVATKADLQGKRIRTPGAGWADFAESAGMTSVSVPFSEIYTAMERGAVDCVAADPAVLHGGGSILPLVKSVLMLPLSPGYGGTHIVYNRDFWKGLTEAQRRILLDQTAVATARGLLETEREVQQGLKEARAAGVVVNDPGADLAAFYADWSTAYRAKVATESRANLGLAEPDRHLDAMQGYIDKWRKLVSGVDRRDADALAAVFKEHLFDTVDVKTYGME